MINFRGKQYYIDVDKAIEQCRPVYPSKKGKTKKAEEQEEDRSLELNVFKFEILKSCIERILLYEYTDNDDDDAILFQERQLPLSFSIAFNTLLKYKILIEKTDG